jgi:hypothetical protein
LLSPHFKVKLAEGFNIQTSPAIMFLGGISVTEIVAFDKTSWGDYSFTLRGRVESIDHSLVVDRQICISNNIGRLFASNSIVLSIS